MSINCQGMGKIINNRRILIFLLLIYVIQIKIVKSQNNLNTMILFFDKNISDSIIFPLWNSPNLSLDYYQWEDTLLCNAICNEDTIYIEKSLIIYSCRKLIINNTKKNKNYYYFSYPIAYQNFRIFIMNFDGIKLYFRKERKNKYYLYRKQ